MRILLALDGSPSSIVARDLVVGLDWPPETEVLLLSAYHTPADWTGGVGSTMDWVGDASDAMREGLEKQQRELAEPLVAAGRSVGYLVVEARAADAISDAARERNMDLVVMGSRGRGTIRSMLLGSVAAEVAAQAPCPVLVARHPTITRLVVATDGSDLAGTIPDRLAALGAFSGMHADAVAVSISDRPAFELIVNLYTLGDERLAAKRQELREHYARDAERLADALTQVGIPTTPHLRTGDPAREIIELARERGADLIVTGTRGLGSLDRLLLGSVARNVLIHSGASVLVVRPTPERRRSDEGQ